MLAETVAPLLVGQPRGVTLQEVRISASGSPLAVLTNGARPPAPSLLPRQYAVA